MLDIERSAPVSVALGQWVIATESNTFRVSRVAPQTEPAAVPGETYRSARTVRALLNGALYAAFASRGKQGQRQPISLTRLIYMLAGSYHHLQTPPRLARAAATFKGLKRDDVAAFLELKVREESGHDRLALRDLTALGLPALTVVEILRPPVSIRLLAHLESYCQRPYPMAVLGYTYCMERLAILYGEKDIKAYQALCPPGVDATRCLRVHSGVGADDEHVDELIEFVATLDKRDVAQIAAAACETAAVMVEALLGDAATTDAEIEIRLRDAGIALPLAA
jgi:Iron-containing redox enzyme